MAAQIAHEVRNPLASIGLNAELLGDEIADDGDEARRLVASIIGEVDRLTEITETYLRFARLPRPKLEREDLGAVVASVVDVRARRAGAGRRSRSTSTSRPGCPRSPPTRRSCGRRCINLVRNAREAMAEPAVGASGWRSRSRRRGGRAASWCAVADSGAGHRRGGHRRRSSIPFFSTKERGTGLGLALVQQIVVEHGGQIEVDSVPGDGNDLHADASPVDGEPRRGRDQRSGVGARRGGGAVGGGRGCRSPRRVVERGERQVQRGRGRWGAKTSARSKAAAAAAVLPVAARARPSAACRSGSAGSMKIAIGASSTTRAERPAFADAQHDLLGDARRSADRGAARPRARRADRPSRCWSP